MEIKTFSELSLKDQFLQFFCNSKFLDFCNSLMNEVYPNLIFCSDSWFRIDPEDK